MAWASNALCLWSASIAPCQQSPHGMRENRYAFNAIKELEYHLPSSWLSGATGASLGSKLSGFACVSARIVLDLCAFPGRDIRPLSRRREIQLECVIVSYRTSDLLEPIGLRPFSRNRRNELPGRGVPSDFHRCTIDPSAASSDARRLTCERPLRVYSVEKLEITTTLDFRHQRFVCTDARVSRT